MTSANAEPLGVWKKTGTFLEMIKISHTVFALPFAIGAAFLAAAGVPSLPVLAKIIGAVVLARTASMSFNRLVDHRIDAQNPRTATRALPAGELSRGFVIAVTIGCVAGFLAIAASLNPLALQLAPVVLVVLLGYSLTKRFTALCHAVLGLALGLAPVGAWVAVRGELDWTPALLALVVLLWTTGFDVIYACMDEAFDRKAGLFSIPARLGIPRALRLAAALHIGMVAALVGLWWYADGLNTIFLCTTGVVSALLIYEHALVRPDDLSRVNRAFFTMNGIISFLVMASLIAESVVA
ncbi:MAG: UbiA-like polyprenyltransferase [Planctomycetota bacterium]